MKILKIIFVILSLLLITSCNKDLNVEVNEVANEVANEVVNEEVEIIVDTEITQNRYFTEYGFSFETDLENVLVFEGDINQDFHKLVNEIENLQLGIEPEINSPSYMYLNEIYFYMNVMSLNLIEDLNDKNLTQVIEQFMTITTEDIEIEGIKGKYTNITYQTDLMANSEEQSHSITEIFTIKYPEQDKYFDLVIGDILNEDNSKNNKIDKFEEIKNIVNSFKYDLDLSLTNKKGLKSFKSISFSSYYNPEYFMNTQSPEHKEVFFSGFGEESIVLKLTNDNYDYYLQVECDIFDEVPNKNNSENYTINDKEFTVYKDKILLEGESTQEIITSISYNDLENGIKTYISLKNTQNNELDTLTQEDLNIINEIFNDIMEDYQVDYNEFMWYMIEMKSNLEI